MPRARKRAPKPSAGAETLSLDPGAVRYWRLQRGWTQEALARQRAVIDGESQSISYAQIRRIEAEGRCGPTSVRILAEVLGVAIGQLSPRDQRHLPCGLPREPSADFVGRELELKGVLAALQGSGSVRIAASIEGLPGIGKTELALQVAGVCERERRFRIFWLDAEQPDLTAVWADAVAPHLGIDLPRPEDRAGAAIRAIESLGEPVLLVLDNVNEWSASRPWPRPRGRHVHWLVTTRASDLGGRQFHHVGVPVLEPTAARQLMLRIAGPELAERPGFAALLEFLGGYTLAVELAASFLRRFPEVDPDEYRADLERGRGAALEEEIGDRTLYGETLQRALELLWERLPSAVRRHWLLAAQFAQAPATLALSDACGLDRRARAALRDYHLIETHSTRGWSMHRLVRAFGRAAGDPGQRTAAGERFFQGCAERGRSMDATTGFELYVPDREHYQAALEVDDMAAIAVASLCLGMGQALLSLGSFAEAREILELGLDLSAADPREGVMFEIRVALGRALLSMGEFAAGTRVVEEGLSLASGLPNPESVEAELGNALGLILREAGEFMRARVCFERSIQWASAALGEEDTTLAVWRSNLALVLEAQGELSSARELHERAVASAIKSLGEDHPTVANLRSNLAVSLYGYGEWEKARTLLEQALASELRTYGEEHHLVAARRSNLSAVLLELNELAEAEHLARQALESAVDRFGEAHSLVTLRRGNLAKVLRASGALPEAVRELERALESEIEILGGGHPEVAVRRGNLAVVLHQMGELSRASSLLEQAVASDLAHFGDRHPRLAELRASLAAVRRSSGDLLGARDLLEPAVGVLRERRGEQHPSAIMASLRLAQVLHDLGERPEAEARARESRRLARLQPPEWRHQRTVEKVVSEVLRGGSDAPPESPERG